ncbi:MAG: sodium:calcium antiporter [Candidatus Hydrogenedentota bacterium]
MMTLLFLLGGLVLLTLGAESLVRGASRLAAAIGISPLVIGLTVVAFGTSAPELVVSTTAAYHNQADLAVGNVVGSNIFNVLFILGLSSLIVPLVVSKQLIRLDVPVMVGVSILLLILAWDGAISRTDGLFLFAGIVIYTAALIRIGRQGGDASELEFNVHAPKNTSFLGSLAANTIYIVIGLGFLVQGSRWLVTSAVEIAQYFGVSELVIGLTIVAAGTSLPEVATSVVASIRGERDIAVGNVVGSNIFNILSVLGMSAILAPGGIPVNASAIGFDIPVMILVAIACLPIFFTGHLIARWEGCLFLAYYVAYTVYLVFHSTNNAALPAFQQVMLWGALPATFVALSILALRDQSTRSSAAG